MSLTVEVLGVAELTRDARELGHSMADLRELTYRLAQPIAALAQAQAPRRTGRLARSIYPVKSRSAVRVRTRRRVRYVAKVHWGATGQGGPQFLVRAADRLEARTIAQLKAGIYQLAINKGWT